jgi:membrane glycosyltransferase
MSKQSDTSTSKAASEFSRQAGQSQTGVFREYVAFLRHNKKWWLIPIVVTLLLVGVLVILGSTAAAPFIYTLF